LIPVHFLMGGGGLVIDGLVGAHPAKGTIRE
jgi:hypothetical protein